MTIIQFPPNTAANDDGPPSSPELPLPAPPSEPLFRIPPVTGGLMLMLGAIYALLYGFSTFIDERVMLAAITQFAFIPASFTDTIGGALPFSIIPFIGLVTAGLLHGSWLHLGVNLSMLLAAGGGVERLLGRCWLLGLMFGGIIVGNLTYLAFNPHSIAPLVGASGGISALFGAAMLLLGSSSPKQVASWLGIFIGLSLLQSFMGGPNGENIAGTAHIGGFVFGLGVTLWRRKNSQA